MSNGRGSVTNARVCRWLPSRDRQGAVTRTEAIQPAQNNARLWYGSLSYHYSYAEDEGRPDA